MVTTEKNDVCIVCRCNDITMISEYQLSVVVIPAIITTIMAIGKLIVDIVLREKRTYWSQSYEDVNVMNKIIAKAKVDYIFASGVSAAYNNTMVPTGVVVGRSFILYIWITYEIVDHKTKAALTLGVYGWWSFNHFKSEMIPTLATPKDTSNVIYTVTSYAWKGSDLSRIKETHMPHTYHANSITMSKKIEMLYQQSPTKNLVVFMCGVRGSGKSKTGIYLNKLIPNSIVYKDFEHSYKWIRHVVNEVVQFVQTGNEDDPIIFIWDEIDEYLLPKKDETLPETVITPTIKVPKPIWNSFIDFIRTIPNIILILTSNVDKTVIDAHDSSLFRKHRVDHVFKYYDDHVEDILWTHTENAVKEMADTDSDMTSIESHQLIMSN
jgi:hypothetical protein